MTPVQQLEFYLVFNIVFTKFMYSADTRTESYKTGDDHVK